MFGYAAFLFSLLTSSPSAEERNVALVSLPAEGALAGDCAAAPLPGDRAGFGAARRLWAMPGPGATLRGVAAVLQEKVLRNVPGWAALADPELARLGAALYRTARRIETGTAVPLSSGGATDHWLVGTMLPLPAWRPASDRLQVDIAGLGTAMAAVGGLSPATVAEWGPTVRPARELDQVDPFASDTAVDGAALVAHAVAERARLRGVATAAATVAQAATLGTAWGARARWNPYAALFPVLELAAAYRDTAPELIKPFSTAFYAEFTPNELDIFASTSAGYAVLRCLWRASEAGRTKTVADLLHAAQTNLTLADDYPTGSGRLEPPVRGGRTEPALPTAASRIDAPNPLMGFGRVVPFTVGGYQGAYRGLRWTGTVPPIEVLGPAVGAPLPHAFVFPSAAHGRQWSRILSAIARTEGNLDAVTAWDSAAASLGFQQWSMHITDSGPALLARLRTLHPEAYDAVVRASEVDAGRGAGPDASTGTAIPDILPECNLWRLGPPGVEHLNPPGYTRARVQAGLGWTRAGGTWVIGDPVARLCARWAVAARFIPAVWQAQAELAYEGIMRITKALTGVGPRVYSPVWNPASWAATIAIGAVPNLPKIDDAGVRRDPTVVELFPGEAAVASILDHSVNLPGDVPTAIGRALRHATAAHDRAHPHDPRPLLVTTEYLLRLLIAHEGTRQLNSRGGVVDVALQRVPRVIREFDDPNGVSLTDPFLWP